ncbi:hypothetical protein BDY21DRAFT_175969 [Lineolata rhizophorae]|uniref:Uncharacterized protein n=1 Tax=Lineolata rhizophorae TaxID=578093 RepID=A0A6A6NLS1_9PEZI|nr:hypothetical protein BDY21DRAFT_175969 [Lineolata rhizophorae]
MFVRYRTYHDEELNMSFHMCCNPSCQFRDSSMIGIHRRCRKLMTNFSSRRFNMTRHSLHPPVEIDTRRRQRAIQLLPRRLKEDALFEEAARLLPRELLDQVVSHLLCESAAVSIEAQVLNSSLLVQAHASDNLQYNTVNLGRDIVADLVSFEGVQYVQNLRNSTVMQAVDSELLLLNTRKTPLPERLYVAEDHLGVRMAIFGRPDRPLPDACMSQGLWWRTLEINADTRLEVQSDVRSTSPIYSCC